MSDYDYKEGKKRVLSILNDENEISETDKVPNEQEFSYSNGYYSWVTAVFVDIRDSTSLFQDNRKRSTAKIIRSFTSEIIEILRDDKNIREIGIRGDCVYAIYTCSTKQEDFEIAKKAYYVNTFLKMLNSLLIKKNMTQINAGIGISTAQELVVKAGRQGCGINNLVWIGNAVTNASYYSSIANGKIEHPIVMSESFYKSIIDLEIKENKESCKWFDKHVDEDNELFYSCGIFMSDFYNWINGGMN